MQIKLSDEFQISFENIFKYISKDKLLAAKEFKKNLFIKIKELPNFPYKYRKSIYFEDDNIRDMIFKGYTIVYKVDSSKKLIVILDIFNQNKR